MKFAGKCMYLENTILKEVTQTQRDRSYMPSYDVLPQIIIVIVREMLADFYRITNW